MKKTGNYIVRHKKNGNTYHFDSALGAAAFLWGKRIAQWELTSESNCTPT